MVSVRVCENLDYCLSTCSSGTGEDILRSCLSSKVAALHDTLPLNDAATRAIVEKAGTAPSPCAILAINSKGQISVQSSGRIFLTASYTASHLKASVMGTTIHLYPQDTFHEDDVVSAGLTRYPITSGHALMVCTGTADLMALTSSKFSDVLNTARQVALAMCSTMNVDRCGLVCDGSQVVSLIPLRGLSKGWEPVVNEVEEYHTVFSGYVTSKNGPKMADSFLDETQNRINTSTRVIQPFNYHFDGDSSDQNLFARIIRGEVPQWRVWEDDAHVAFLTPFGTTPGFTVLVPRKHLQSDIFRLEDQEYAGMAKAAHVVAQYLKDAFKIQRCGLIFEGYEIDYAHVKLIPVHKEESSQISSFNAVVGSASFHDCYKGYLTSQFGTLTSDFSSLPGEADKIRRCLRTKTAIVGPPNTWRNPDTHWVEVRKSPWYMAFLWLENNLRRFTMRFFFQQTGFKYAWVLSSTDSYTPHLGLGYALVPLSVSRHRENAHLADSMQFAHEYLLRTENSIRGAYHIGNSPRCDDSKRFNRFNHVECEIAGNLDDGICVAESYIAFVVGALLDSHHSTIEAIAGGTAHITALLSMLESNQDCFPRITLDEALALPEMASSANTWTYVSSKNHSKGRVLTRTGERVLIDKFNGAVWITEMDHLTVPFHQAFVPDTKNSKALCADLLLGQGEMLRLGQRHIDVETVQEALKMREMPEKNHEWYMGIRDDAKGGRAMQTTGLGMRTERLLSWLLKQDDIRDFAFIPRLKDVEVPPYP